MVRSVHDSSLFAIPKTVPYWTFLTWNVLDSVTGGCAHCTGILEVPETERVAQSGAVGAGTLASVKS